MNQYFLVNILFISTIIVLLGNMYLQADLIKDYYDVPQEVWDWVSQHQYYEIDNSNTMILCVVFVFFLSLQFIFIYFQEVFTFWVESYNQIAIIKIGMITNIVMAFLTFVVSILFYNEASHQIIEWGIYNDCMNTEERIYDDLWVDSSIKELCDFVDQGLFNGKWCIWITLFQSALIVGYIGTMNHFLMHNSGKFVFNCIEINIPIPEVNKQQQQNDKQKVENKQEIKTPPPKQQC